jgi:hypothetical protein
MIPDLDHGNRLPPRSLTMTHLRIAATISQEKIDDGKAIP